MDTTIVVGGAKYKILRTRQEILQRIEELALQIASDYVNDDSSKPPILLYVLTGGLFLGVDLSRALDRIGFDHSVDTIGLHRYKADEQGGTIKITSQPRAKLGGRRLIIVEDIIDVGLSMNSLEKRLRNLRIPPKSIEYCALFLKDNHEPLDFEIKYLGWTIGPEWVVGNGMDSEQSKRGLSDVYVKI